MQKLHLDTDLGGDIDDLCALAMLLRWPEDIRLTGITTVAEANGRRAGYAHYVLGLEGRSDIPIAAGAEVSGGYYRYAELGYPNEERYWPEQIALSPNAAADAILLLKQSVEEDATIVAIGPYTNLFLLDLQYPGILWDVNLVLMGGYLYPTSPGYPDWGNEMDWNIQVDVKSAEHVIENSNPTLVPLTVTVETALRRTHLNDLRKAGVLGQIIAQQAEAFAIDEQIEKRFGQTCERLPADIINFLHDPLACAISLGWSEGIEIADIPIDLEEKDGWLHERIDPLGKPVRVVTKVDGRRFSEFWVNILTGR